jgi:hypothetical protein
MTAAVLEAADASSLCLLLPFQNWRMIQLDLLKLESKGRSGDDQGVQGLTLMLMLVLLLLMVLLLPLPPPPLPPSPFDPVE